MSLITMGLGHATIITFGLGISFKTQAPHRPEPAEILSNVQFKNIPIGETFENKEATK